MYSDCGAGGVRSYQHDFIDEEASAGLVHPYGVAAEPNTGHIYVTAQDTNVVLRFDRQGKPLPFPPYFNGSTDYYPGTFVQFDTTSNGVRGLAFVNSTLWVATEDGAGIQLVDPNGYPSGFVDLVKPVGVFAYAADGIVYASGHDSHDPKVIGVNMADLSVRVTYKIPGEAHPTGLTRYGNMLYVLGMTTATLWSIDVTTGDTQPVVQQFDEVTEQLILSNC